MNTKKLIDSLAINTNEDFIILNTYLRSTSLAAPTLSILKFKNDNHYNIIRSYYDYDLQTKKSELKSDSNLWGFVPQIIFDIAEPYFYENKKSEKVFETNEILKKQNKKYRGYIFVGRISGKTFVKRLYIEGDFNW